MSTENNPMTTATAEQPDAQAAIDAEERAAFDAIMQDQPDTDATLVEDGDNPEADAPDEQDTTQTPESPDSVPDVSDQGDQAAAEPDPDASDTAEEDADFAAAWDAHMRAGVYDAQQLEKQYTADPDAFVASGKQLADKLSQSQADGGGEGKDAPADTTQTPAFDLEALLEEQMKPLNDDPDFADFAGPVKSVLKGVAENLLAQAGGGNTQKVIEQIKQQSEAQVQALQDQFTANLNQMKLDTLSDRMADTYPELKDAEARERVYKRYDQLANLKGYTTVEQVLKDAARLELGDANVARIKQDLMKRYRDRKNGQPNVGDRPQPQPKLSADAKERQAFDEIYGKTIAKRDQT